MKTKPRRALWIATIAAAVAGVPAAVVTAAETSVANPTPTTAPSTAPADFANISSVDLIRQATTPSAAVDAYTRASAQTPNNLDIEKAYVQRMVQLNLPEIADAQARDVVQRDPTDGVALAVTAYMSALQGQSGRAAQTLKNAIERVPSDPFVIRTAAQVVAWYDSQTDRSNLTEADRQAFESLRTAGKNNTVFGAAYLAATEMQRARRAEAAGAISRPIAPTTQPQQQTYVSPSSPADVYISSPSTDLYGSEPAGVYVSPPATSDYTNNYYYYSSPYAYYDPVYPYWGWWPGGAIIFSDFDFVGHFGHRDFDDFHRFHRGFDDFRGARFDGRDGRDGRFGDGHFDRGERFNDRGDGFHDGREGTMGIPRGTPRGNPGAGPDRGSGRGPMMGPRGSAGPRGGGGGGGFRGGGGGGGHGGGGGGGHGR